MPHSVRVAVIQPEGCAFDTSRAIDTVVAGIADAAARGARVALFPEAFVGGYPWGLTFGAAIGGRTPEGRELWRRYHEAAVEVESPEIERIGEAAREFGVHVGVGIVERDGGTLYCTLLLIDDMGAVRGRHRKLKPTAAERVIWGEGDGSTLDVMATPYGTVGGLICWEHYMPLARMAMYDRQVALWFAPTADARDTWQATLRHVALEGRCFVLGANQFVTRAQYADDLPLGVDPSTLPPVLCRGGSVIVSPLGEVLAGPLWDEAGVLVADLDLGAIVRGKFDFDVVGHYARPDVFRLQVDRQVRTAVD